MVRVHVRQLAPPSFDLFAHVAIAQRVYGKYGVYFCLASMASVNAPTEVQARLAAVGVGPGQGSAQWAELYARYGVQDLASITVFIVRSLVRLPLRAGLHGTADSRPQRPSVVLRSQVADWVLAHEVGHILLGDSMPGHSSGKNELMREGPGHTTTEVDPVFSDRQVEAIRRSRYALPC